MKQLKKLLLFTAVLFLLNACEEKPLQLVQISFQLKDNITPTLVTFKLNAEASRSIWKLNNQYIFRSDSNSVEIYLENPGKI